MTGRPGRQARAGASSETARRINRDVLLQTVHRLQPVSRADLARQTGLQPSTVSAIVGELIAEDWLVSDSLGRLPRGRRPTFLTLNARHSALAIDLRPDSANLAVVDINGRILQRSKAMLRETAPGRAGRRVVAAIAREAAKLRSACRGQIFHGVGVSVSGRVDQATRRVLFSPNAPWSQIDLHQELSAALKAPVELDNAANASLLAERWFGEAGEIANTIAVSVSEGVGSGLMVDGVLLRGRDGLAGEFGHMPFDDAGPLCGCGNRGCWETFASNRAGLRYYKEAVPGATIDSFQELLQLAAGGDILALRAIDRMACALARGLAVLSAGLAPELILIVGDCTALWPRLCPIFESQLIARSFTSRIPRLLPAMEGDAARLRGAAALVLHKVLFQQTPAP